MITSITHIALNVSDMDKSLEFYIGVLGFKEAFVLYNDSKPWIRYIKAGASQFIELFYGGSGNYVNNTFAHLCFEVDDINEIAALLESRGLLTSPVRQGRDHNWQCWTKDPDGNPIELMQLSPESPQAKALKEL